ncbi:TetR/AcrR family transcriptional regulator [Chitinivorax sp. PXF-14]|uniref:TetR/AcrR family transcriptional regulator n=1 Tax=Chitinivorax sp. PXF-14 TaxID=3230488 RepID=UPI0034673BA8
MNAEQTEPIDSQNHRTRVGIERRQKMRTRLIESAFVVFSRMGVDVSVIDDVIAEAGVSRGTFYNYFRTNTELMAAVGETLSDELVGLIEETVGGLDDPVEILATGLRLFLRTASAYPHFADFIWRAGFNLDAAGSLIRTYLPRHIAASMERGSLQVADVFTALEVMMGIMLAAIFGISMRAPADDYPERIVQHILQALGVQRQEALRLTALPLPLPAISLPADSLIARSHQGKAAS